MKKLNCGVSLRYSSGSDVLIDAEGSEGFEGREGLEGWEGTGRSGSV